ncbi:MAG TPA: hypothetical protein VN698_04585, partial [Bacteroidia bacterium]|nr:hypothetical protein [Bacteroidia bacterium]
MKKYILMTLSAAIVFSSCVSKKKFHKEQARINVLQKDSADTHTSLNGCNSKVADLENEKLEIQKNLSNLSTSSQTAIENSKMTIAEQAKRLKDLQNLIQSQKDILTKLKKTMADALINFKPDELTV